MVEQAMDQGDQHGWNLLCRSSQQVWDEGILLSMLCRGYTDGRFTIQAA